MISAISLNAPSSFEFGPYPPGSRLEFVQVTAEVVAATAVGVRVKVEVGDGLSFVTVTRSDGVADANGDEVAFLITAGQSVSIPAWAMGLRFRVSVRALNSAVLTIGVAVRPPFKHQ